MNIYLHVEISVRELDSKLLLAVLAASKGHHVIISSMTEIINGIRTGILKPGIFHTKSLSPSKDKINRHQEVIDNRFVVTSIDEEGGFLNNNQNVFIKRRFSEKTIDQASAVFGWGRDIEILKNNFSKNSLKMHKTGSPRIDLSKPFFNDYWLKPKKIPKKPYLLVSSNFNCTSDKPFYEVLNQLRISGYLQRNPEMFKTEFERMSEEYIMLYAFIDAIKKLGYNNNDYDIVLRPHPGEPLEAWKVFFNDIPNVHVIKEDTIMPWIKNAFALLHNSCSTAVEAVVAGTPVISYVPFKRKHLQKDFANKLGRNVETFEDLLKNTKLLFENNQYNDRMVEKSYETLSERIFIDKNEHSADKIIRVWESLGNKIVSKSNNWMKFYWLCKIINLRRTLRKIISKLPFNKFKPIKKNNKFPTFDENDIYERIRRLQNILGIEKKLEFKILSDRTILIKPK